MSNITWEGRAIHEYSLEDIATIRNQLVDALKDIEDSELRINALLKANKYIPDPKIVSFYREAIAAIDEAFDSLKQGTATCQIQHTLPEETE